MFANVFRRATDFEPLSYESDLRRKGRHFSFASKSRRA